MVIAFRLFVHLLVRVISLMIFLYVLFIFVMFVYRYVNVNVIVILVSARAIIVFSLLAPVIRRNCAKA